jgi:hypothetical protein
MDVMTVPPVLSASMALAAIVVEILEPSGAHFVAMDDPPIGGGYEYEYWDGSAWRRFDSGSSVPGARRVRATRQDPGGTVLNTGNSSTYYFGLAGRDGTETLRLDVQVELASSVWEVRELDIGEGMLGGASANPC